MLSTEKDDEDHVYVNTIEQLSISPNWVNKFEEATMVCDELSRFRDSCKNRPDLKTEAHEVIKPYWPYRDEIHCENGLVLRSNRIIVPRSMVKDVLSDIHKSHCGFQKTLLRAKDCLYWRGMVILTSRSL